MKLKQVPFMEEVQVPETGSPVATSHTDTLLLISETEYSSRKRTVTGAQA